MDFSTLKPIDYTINQPQITPISKRMSDVLTLADMLDKRKMSKMALADAERKQQAQEAMRQQAQTELEAYNAPVPAVTAPDSQAFYNERAGLEPTSPENIDRLQQIGATITPEYQSIKPAQYQGSILDKPPQMTNKTYTDFGLKGGVPDQDLSSIMPTTETTPASAMVPSYEQFAQGSPMAQDRAKQEQAVVEATPEARIPASYKWMSPDEYGHFIKAQTLDPEYAGQYVKDLVDQKYKLAQTDKALREQEVKDKTAAEQRRMEMEIKKHSLVSNIFNGAKTDIGDYDPQSVATAVARARSMGFDVDRLPDNPTKDQINDWMAEDTAMKKDSKSTDPYVEQKARFNQEKDLRDSFQNQAKQFVTMRDQYSRMMSLDPNNAAGQIGLVYSIMKLYDPGSVVRETEYATAQNAAGVPTVVRNMWNKVLSGEFLAPQQIKDFKGQATNLYGSAEKSFNGLKDHYSKISMDYGIKPTNVTGGLDISKYKVEEVK